MELNSTNLVARYAMRVVRIEQIREIFFNVASHANWELPLWRAKKG